MEKKKIITKVSEIVAIFILIASCFLIIEICFMSQSNYFIRTYKITLLILEITLLLAVIVGSIRLLTVFKRGLHNLKYCDDDLWEEIDTYKHRWIENGEYYKKMIRVLSFFYQKKGKVDKLVKNQEVDRLFCRLDFLNAQMEFDNDLKSAIQSLMISVVASVIYGIITKNDFNQLLSIIIEVLSIFSFFLIIIVFYSYRGKFGSYDYLINRYEKELLLKKIEKLNEVLWVSLENEETLKAQQIVIDELIERCKKAKKEKQNDIEKDIHLVEGLQLDIKSKKKLIAREVEVGKSKIKLYYRKDKKTGICCDYNHLINAQYEKLYEILEKYGWL